jgi:hypothetical protein
MTRTRDLAKAVGLEVRKVHGRFRIWNPRSGSHLDVKRKKRAKKFLRWLSKRS